MSVESINEMAAKSKRRQRFRMKEEFLDLLRDEELEVSPVSKTTYNGCWYECVVGVGADHTATLRMPEETILANPEYFEEVGVAGTSEEEAE